MAAVDAVIATSDEVLRGLGSVPHPTLVIGNGADTSHFTPPAGGVDTRPAVCVYVGALDARFDWRQLSVWAHARPTVRFVVAGPSPKPSAPLPANIDLQGAVPYGKLPALLQDARVGILPLSDDPLNAGRSPMKLYEYLAAGLAVVATETSVIRSDADAGLFTYGSLSEASVALDRALMHPSPNIGGMRRAARESWDKKTDEIVEFLVGLEES